MKKAKKFPVGGVDIPGRKDLANGLELKRLPFPEKVVIPFQQHIGKPGQIIVKKGDYVQRGQCIVEKADGVSASSHASISGKIINISEITAAGGQKLKAFIIEKTNDSGSGKINFKKTKENEITSETVLELIKNAGIIGMGGAGFPTHIKLNPPPDKKIDTVIINGAECEPYISIDDRTMRESPEFVFRGLELIKKTVGAKRGIIACEENKPEAISRLKKEEKNWPQLFCEVIDSRYPHGAEKKLIEAILNRESPEDKLPMDVGVVVNNVQTAIAVANAVDNGSPLLDRPITVSGRGIARPANLIVPVGTTVQDIITYCGGITADNCRIIMGGPMTGTRITNLEIPICKTDIGLVVLTAEEYDEYESRVCIRCGKCTDVCPVYITPNRITDFINNNMIEEAKKLSLKTCIECGACAYICPSKRPLLRWLKQGKEELERL